MGVPNLDDFHRLRVMTWACAVMTVCGGRTDTVRKLFRKKGKITSTDFNRCLAEGRPLMATQIPPSMATSNSPT